MTTITPGRHPTFGEVIDYYTQAAFLSFLLDTLRYRRVVLVISRKKHWEPDWSRYEMTGQTVAELRDQITRYIDHVLGDVPRDRRPDFYPAFHQSVWKGDPDDTGNRDRYMDCVFEADLPLWRDAFQDVTAVADLFEHYGAPYHHKFSGHRSLHLIVPGESLPQGYRGKSSGKLAHALTAWSSSQAHHLPKITRMPYSLNEDTGLVCLPIERGTLDTFRPWQANLHLVDVPGEAWEPRSGGAGVDALAALVRDLEAAARMPRPVRRTPPVPESAAVLDPYRARMAFLAGDGPSARAWGGLSATETIPEAHLIETLAGGDPDTRWLAAEAYILHGASLTRVGFEALAREEDPYARAAAIDILLRFQETLVPVATAALRDLDTDSPTGATATYLLTQSPPLREAAFAALLTDRGDTQEARISVACLTGAMVQDWRRASEILAPLRATTATPDDRLRKRLAAIDIMQDLGSWDKQAEAERAFRLAELGTDITDLLLIAAHSPDRRFRRAVVSALAEIADPRATDHLIRALDDDYTKVRRRAITGLTRIGEAAVDALIAATDSDQVRLRRYAIVCLGHIGAPRAKHVIIEALNDSEEEVRRQALRALKEHATPDDLTTLQEFLREAQPRNAIEALEILEALGLPAAEALRTMAFAEQNLAAATFIAKQGDDAGRALLVAALEAGGERSADAAEYLRHLRDPRCVPTLVRQFHELTDWEGMFVARELGVIGTGEAVAALIEGLSRDNHLIRRGAARGLDEAMDPAAIEPLIVALEDEDNGTRKQAAETLRRFGEVAMPHLERALAAVDPDDGRRRSILTRVLSEIAAAID